MSLDSIVENVWAKAVARYVMPAAGAILVSGVIWYAGKLDTALEKHSNKIDAVFTQASEAANRVELAAKELKGLRDDSNRRFSETATRGDRLETKIDGLDTRLRQVEIKVRP